MLMRICQGCGRRVPQGAQCPCAKGRHKEYDKSCRDKGATAFYHSRGWSRLTAAIKARAGGCDEYIRHWDGRLVPGNTIHHIELLDERPDLALSPENLICVSPATHRAIHDRYALGKSERLAMQQRLREAIGTPEALPDGVYRG